MATSAFKSNTRRGSARSGGSENSQKAPIRRSHSVSSLSRASDHHQQFDISWDFLNKRDNPLFCSDVSPPDKQIQNQSPVGLAQFAQNPTKVSGSALPSKTGSAYAQRERGRPLTRNELAGRSLSGLDRGRRGRSFSRGHYAASGGGLEQFSVVSPNYRSKSSLNVSANGLKKANIQRKSSELRAIVEPSDNSAVSESYLEAPNLGDGISTGSLSEAEEKTIRAVCEQMKSSQGDHVGGVDNAANGIYETVRSEVRRAILDIQNDLESAIRRNNDAAIAGKNVADIPPDLVNPGELVVDIRREYARKLEESQERARKLRGDLAIEEQRGQELSKILMEILPDPKTNNVQKSRPGRKNSSERRKMSKRLTEEAMAYFDECVSISTFDSSDFSAPEDLPFSLTAATTLERAPAYLDHGSPSVSTSCCHSSCLNHKQLQESSCLGLPMGSHMDSGLTASSGSNEPMINQASLIGNTSGWSQKLQFSFSQKPSESIGLEQLIRNYIENAEEESEQNRINAENTRLNYHGVNEYLQGRTESLLFDRVLLKNRIDTGSLHLCCGSMAISCSPFGSVI